LTEGNITDASENVSTAPQGNLFEYDGLYYQSEPNFEPIFHRGYISCTAKSASQVNNSFLNIFLSTFIDKTILVMNSFWGTFAKSCFGFGSTKTRMSEFQ